PGDEPDMVLAGHLDLPAGRPPGEAYRVPDEGRRRALEPSERRRVLHHDFAPRTCWTRICAASWSIAVANNGSSCSASASHAGNPCAFIPSGPSAFHTTTATVARGARRPSAIDKASSMPESTACAC